MGSFFSAPSPPPLPPAPEPVKDTSAATLAERDQRRAGTVGRELAEEEDVQTLGGAASAGSLGGTRKRTGRTAASQLGG